MDACESSPSSGVGNLLEFPSDRIPTAVSEPQSQRHALANTIESRVHNFDAGGKLELLAENVRSAAGA
jgi:hypothetical protein